MVAAVLAFLALLPVGWLYLVSGLVVPGPWLFLFWAFFLAAVVVAVRLARRRSYWVLAVPVVTGLVWWAGVAAGEAFLGWTG